MPLLLLIAKSGCGKTEIAKHFPELVAFTTRDQRENEIDSVQYHFKNKAEIEEQISKLNGTSDDSILEYGTYGGHYYGTLKTEFDEKISKHNIVVNTSEIEGALIMRRKFPDLVRLLWIETKELTRIQRLRDRAKETGESEEKINERIHEDHRDKEKELCDYVIYNDSEIEQAVEQVKRYAKMLDNESKNQALNALALLTRTCLSEMIVSYYQIMIGFDMYEQFNSGLSDNAGISRKIDNDIEFLNSLRNDKPADVVQAINYLIDYLHSIQTYLSMKI